MFPNMHKVTLICLTMPVSSAYVKRSFSKIKFIKTHVQISLSDGRLSHLMKIAIVSLKKLTEDEIEGLMEVWN